MRVASIIACLLFAAPAIADQAAPDVPKAKKSVTVKGKTHHLGFIKKHVAHARHLKLEAIKLPASYDAVAAGKATPVKDDGQGSCGDCWAWARTSSLEAASISSGIYTATLKLSEEDTTVNASDESGCDGGSMDFNYEINHGVTMQASCPFTGGDTACSAAPVVKGVTMAYVGGDNGPTDAELMTAIYQYGSVAVTVAAGDEFDVDAGSDRMTTCGSTQIDHMVSLVGFRPSPSGGVEYKMKNSWGPSWGAAGYAYMALGCNQIATGDQSAMVISVTDAPPTPVPPAPVPPPAPTPVPPPPPPPAAWQCNAGPLFGGAVYTGTGGSESAAGAAAKAACRADGHWFCHVTGCTQS